MAGKYDADAKDSDVVADAKEAFEEASSAEDANRLRALDDLRFARLGEQWPELIAKDRQADGRPMLTVNKLPTHIRQVVNDARQNKPSVKARPVDSGADPETAELFNGIIRNIEAQSSADIAYDTAIEFAVSSGFGYWRVVMDYAHDDTFEMDLTIEEVPDPFAVYGDPLATSKDGSDWCSAFVLERMAKSKFEQRYPDNEPSDFENDKRSITEDTETVAIAEWWTREETQRRLVMLTNGDVVDAERLKDEAFREELAVAGVEVDTFKRERPVMSYKVMQCIVSGSEVLEKRDWPGRWIPIIPVYGDEVNIEGERHFLSLIHFAKDPQRMLNFWRTNGAEMLALAPRVPWIGPEGTFGGVDSAKWATANQRSWSTLEYNGSIQPTRVQLDATAIGSMQEALTAADDIKAVIGQFDASLGARSNETTGRAILARQREGDISTFHFLDNLTRSIRQSGRILIDLIPHVWPDERIVRLMGEDGTVTAQKVNGPVPVLDEKTGQPVMEPDPAQLPMMGVQPMRPKTRIYSLTAGKYDLTAAAGPSYTTKREESAEQMMEFIRLFPAAAPVIGDLLAGNLDWPGADEIAKRLKALVPQGAEGGIPPELEKQIKDGMAQLQKLQAENQALKADKSVEAAKVAADQEKAKGELALKAEELRIKRMEAETRQFEAQTKRLEAMKPEPAPQPRPAKAA